MITAAHARELFSYCPGSGQLTWAVRRQKIRIGAVAGCEGGNGYLQVGADGRMYKVHRLIWLMTYGAWPPHDIDHINGVRDDNRLENLRAVTRQENLRNQKRYSANTSGVLGVGWYKARSKWYARIMVDSKDIHLGYFDDWFEAVCARKSAEVKHGYHPNHGRCS